MRDGEEWLSFVEGAFKSEYQIHPTREVNWIRRSLPGGDWAYSGPKTLQGVDGKPRRARARIEGKTYLRHRLVALAKDGTAEGLAKFRDWKNNPVLHVKRRREDERPDDSPDNVEFGTQKDNVNDPNNKKRKPSSLGHPVILTNVETGAKESFESAFATSNFLGARAGSLNRYLNRKAGSLRCMPKCAMEGVWDAAYDEFELSDAVRLVRARAKLYLSPSSPNRLFRKLKTGKFCSTDLERGECGYVSVLAGGGVVEYLHVLIVETLRPGAFDAKLATMHTGTKKKSLQVDHIDGDRSNNAIDNLRVVDRNEHARKHALAIEWIDETDTVLETFECAADVVATVRGTNGKPLNQGGVHYVCDGVYTHTGGRRFRWKDEDLVKAKRAAKLSKRSGATPISA